MNAMAVTRNPFQRQRHPSWLGLHSL
jgi:hypothetical protein